MSDPIVDPTDLGTYLNDSTINSERAELMIGQAQALCETIVTPLTAAAAVVVMRVAARGYTTAAQSRANAQMAAAGSPFQSGPAGGVYLTRYDKSDLRRTASGSNAYSISMLPASYSPTLPPWDVSSEDTTVSTT